MQTESTDTLSDLIPAGKLGQLCELSRLVSGTLDLSRAQNAILVGAMTLTLADYGSIQLFEQDGSGTVNPDRREGTLEGDMALRCDELVAPWVAEQGTLLRSLDLAAPMHEVSGR